MRSRKSEVQRTVVCEARRSVFRDTQACHCRPSDTDGALQGFAPCALQRPDDRPHAPRVLRPRRADTQYAANRNDPFQPLRPRLLPHPEGSPHHSRPRRQNQHRDAPHSRGHRLPQPRPWRLGGKVDVFEILPFI